MINKFKENFINVISPIIFGIIIFAAFILLICDNIVLTINNAELQNQINNNVIEYNIKNKGE